MDGQVKPETPKGATNSGSVLTRENLSVASFYLT